MVDILRLMDERVFMKRAIELAQQAEGQTSPNPAVGAVVVRNGKIIGEGYHKSCGLPHAEREALKNIDAQGADIFVTLEPCSTKGKTGACVQALIEAGVKRCIYAVKDPNPAHAGAADELLQAAGIQVESGLCEQEAADLIRGFSHVQKYERPWVIAKSAMSLDGRITRPGQEGQWLTGPASRERVQKLRAQVDAIVTGAQTVRSDDPSLNVRFKPVQRQPRRVVMSRKPLARDYKIFTDSHAKDTLEIVNASPEDVLRRLAKEGVNTVLLEAGGELLGLFNDAGLIDEWYLFIAPLITGGEQAGVAGEGAASLAEIRSFDSVRYEKIADDVLLIAR